MLTVAGDPALTKWYHLVWTTHRRKRTFKIPAAARFCERAVARACRDAGCDPDTVRVTPTSVHVLVRATTSTSRTALARSLKTAVERTLRGSGGVQRPARRVLSTGGWCRTVTSPKGVVALRCYLTSLGPPETPV